VNPLLVGFLVLNCTFVGALVGMWLHGVLPAQHLSAESSGTVKVGIGLVATMTALVLGLITGSAKTSFDAVNSEIRDTAADILSLDRVLARFGPGSDEPRVALHALVSNRLDAIWPLDGRTPLLRVPDVRAAENFAGQIQALAPQTDEQTWLRTRAVNLTESLLEARWLIVAGDSTAVLAPFLAALLFWLAITFMSFGLFAPRNLTVIATLFVCSIAVSSAVFLVLEMDGPFEGVVKVSPQPLRYALEQMKH
jgi:hypothetical protein